MSYDPEANVLRIVLKSTPVAESYEDKPRVIVDYDRDGNVVGGGDLRERVRIVPPFPRTSTQHRLPLSLCPHTLGGAEGDEEYEEAGDLDEEDGEE